ncbi:MAG: rhodanese-like domain-containing protein [Clostridia bacterium]|nr:rhodanese-like domain-containing protein [Clostridia bacterium]
MKCKRCCSSVDISGIELKNMQKEIHNLVILDVRSPQEYEEGHITGSTLLPNYEVIKKVGNVLPDKKTFIVVYCQNGGRSRKTACILKQMGYLNAFNLKGGLEEYLKQ